MESIACGTVPARTSHDCALSKQELRHIHDKIDSPHPFDDWYANLDPWNRGMIFASHLKH